jgi:DNA-binding XRE family transcriptional regulator
MSDVPYKQSDAFGKRVRKMRRYLDMTQEELANSVGTSRSHISSLERGDYDPKLDTVKKVAKAFKISLDELVIGL